LVAEFERIRKISYIAVIPPALKALADEDARPKRWPGKKDRFRAIAEVGFTCYLNYLKQKIIDKI